VDISDDGHLLIRPHGQTGETTLKLSWLVEKLRSEGARLPVLIRFSDILHDRVNSLCAAFQNHIDAHQYEGHYTAVYPVKVNQQRRVVEEIIQAESPPRETARSGWKPAVNRSSSRSWPCRVSRARSLSATATKTGNTSVWHCWAASWGTGSSSWWRNSRNCR